jgi:hypothetical protein
MKKINKLILGGVITVGIFALASQGIQYVLKGPKMPFNAILVSGKSEDVKEAKEIYKDNTNYTKDYKYKIVTQDEPVVENGEKLKNTQTYIVMTKDTAKAMIKDQIFREKIDETSNLDTQLLKEMPNIDGNETLILGSDHYKDISKLNIQEIELSMKYGNYSWMGYHPSKGTIIITDDKTYDALKDSELDMTLIRFKKGTLDVREASDMAKVRNTLSGVADNIEINYSIIED